MSNNNQSNQDFLLDRSMRPKAKPNAQGQQQGLKIQVEERNGTCNGIDLSYAVRKDAWVNMTLPAVEYQCFVDAVEDAYAGRLDKPITISEFRKEVEFAKLTVFLDQDGIITATLESQGNRVDVKWMPLKAYPITSGGQQISPAEQSKRNARAWVKQQRFIIDRLFNSFKPFNPNNMGKPQYGNKGYNQKPQYQQQQTPYSPPPAAAPATATTDDFF